MEIESLLCVAESLGQVSPGELPDAKRLVDDTSRLITALRRALLRRT
jgi:hypothetical protein